MDRDVMIGISCGLGCSAVMLFPLAVAVLVGTITKNRFGFNFRPVKCPECRAPMPMVRMPKNVSQIFFGGCTCPECDCEYDKWGRRVES
jgi:hypothetical protein